MSNSIEPKSFGQEIFQGGAESFAGVTSVQIISRIKTEWFNHGKLPHPATLHKGYFPLLSGAVPGITSAYGCNYVFLNWIKSIKGDDKLSALEKVGIAGASAFCTSPFATIFEFIMTDEQVNGKKGLQAFKDILKNKNFWKRFPGGLQIGIREMQVTSMLIAGSDAVQKGIKRLFPEQFQEKHELAIERVAVGGNGALIGILSLYNDIAKTRIQTAAVEGKPIPSGRVAVLQFIKEQGIPKTGGAAMIRAMFISVFLLSANETHHRFFKA